MKPAKFKSIYCKIFDSIVNPPLKKRDLDKIIDSDYSISYNPNFFCIINREGLSFEYISKNMISCLGMHDFELNEYNLNSIWNRIHPKDMSCLNSSLDKLLVFIEKLSKTNTQQFSYSWNYRLKKYNGTYVNIIQCTTPFLLSENNLKKGLIHFQIINSQFEIPIQASLHLRSSNGDFNTIYSDNCSQNAFLKNVSRREKDIINLLAEDYTSKSIAKRLFISSNTVDTHRRNILKKLKLSSTGELMSIIKRQQHLI